MRRELFTEITINAPPERVWRILIDFSQFPEWNPFIREIEGELKEGSRLKVRIEPPGGTGMTFKPVIKRIALNRELRWLGHLIVPGLFDGEHSFEILPGGNGKVRFVQRETFRGLLVQPFWKSLEGPTKQGFTDMNAALKQRAERLVDSEGGQGE